MGNANSQAHSRPLSASYGPLATTSSHFSVSFLRSCLHSLLRFLTYSSLAYSHWASILRMPGCNAGLGHRTPPWPPQFLGASSMLWLAHPSLPIFPSQPNDQLPQLAHAKSGACDLGQWKESNLRGYRLRVLFHLVFHFPFHTKCPSTFSGLAEGSFLYRHQASQPNSTPSSGTDTKPLSATDNLNTKMNNQPTNLEPSHPPARDGVSTTLQFILTSGKQ